MPNSSLLAVPQSETAQLHHPGTAGQATHNRQQVFLARSFLPSTSHDLWLIETGFVRTLSYLEDGTTVPLGVWGRGDRISTQHATDHPCRVECITKVEARRIAITNVQQINEVLLAYLQQAEELMLIRSHRRVEPMLIRLLSWLAKRFGASVDRGQMLELRLTHQDIADLLGATRVTITRSLQHLEQQGLIERMPLRRVLLCESEAWFYEI